MHLLPACLHGFILPYVQIYHAYPFTFDKNSLQRTSSFCQTGVYRLQLWLAVVKTQHPGGHADFLPIVNTLPSITVQALKDIRKQKIYKKKVTLVSHKHLSSAQSVLCNSQEMTEARCLTPQQLPSSRSIDPDWSINYKINNLMWSMQSENIHWHNHFLKMRF